MDKNKLRIPRPPRIPNNPTHKDVEKVRAWLNKAAQATKEQIRLMREHDPTIFDRE